MKAEWQIEQHRRADPSCPRCKGDGYVVFSCGTPWSCTCTKRRALSEAEEG